MDNRKYSIRESLERLVRSNKSRKETLFILGIIILSKIHYSSENFGLRYSAFDLPELNSFRRVF